mgnify:CR=1 FL=1
MWYFSCIFSSPCFYHYTILGWQGRQIEQRIQTDVALRWYLGLDLFDRVPDHSTISQLRRRKPSFRKVFRRLFEEVVRQCVEKGLVSGRLVVTSGSRANRSSPRYHRSAPSV